MNYQNRSVIHRFCTLLDNGLRVWKRSRFKFNIAQVKTLCPNHRRCFTATIDSCCWFRESVGAEKIYAINVLLFKDNQNALGISRGSFRNLKESCLSNQNSLKINVISRNNTKRGLLFDQQRKTETKSDYAYCNK